MIYISYNLRLAIMGPCHLSDNPVVCHACTPLPQRPVAANSYYNPLAVRVHPPVPASGVLHEKMWLSPKISKKNFVFDFFVFCIKWSETSKKRKKI